MSSTLRLVVVVLALGVMAMSSADALAGEDSVKGSVTVNGKTAELDHVYVYTEEHPFNEGETAYVFCFTDTEVPYAEIKSVWTEDDIVSLEVKVGSDQETYSQNLRHPALSTGHVSGSGFHKVDFEAFGPDTFKGRVFTEEEEEFFDDTFRYDVAFTVTLPSEQEVKGDPLPADGGEPGKAYLEFIKAVAGGDLEEIKRFAPPDGMAELEGPDAEEMLELLQMMTPSEVTILRGFIQGDRATLEVEAVLDGEKSNGDITMVKMEGAWLPQKSSWH